VKIREVIKIIEADGWVLVRTKGSHPEKPGTVTTPGKPFDDLSAGLLNSILRQAGLRG
jgi:predicted RNA binding protein YcfA (HicA-like mRNA interferase family)